MPLSLIARATAYYLQHGGLVEYALDAVLSSCEEGVLEAASLGMSDDSALEERLERLPRHPLDGAWLVVWTRRRLLRCLMTDNYNSKNFILSHSLPTHALCRKF